VSGLKTASLGRRCASTEMALLSHNPVFKGLQLFDKWSRSNSSLDFQTWINQVGLTRTGAVAQLVER
jgi:hypothetical protein